MNETGTLREPHPRLVSDTIKRILNHKRRSRYVIMWGQRASYAVGTAHEKSTATKPRCSVDGERLRAALDKQPHIHILCPTHSREREFQFRIRQHRSARTANSAASRTRANSFFICGNCHPEQHKESRNCRMRSFVAPNHRRPPDDNVASNWNSL